MTVRIATIGLGLAALLSFEALALNTIERGLPWLVASVLYALACWRIWDRPVAARWLAVAGAVFASPLAWSGVTYGMEPTALWVIRPLVCAVAPWLAIAHPLTSPPKLIVAIVNVGIELAAAAFTLAILIKVATDPSPGMTGLLAVMSVNLIGWPWIVPGLLLASLLALALAPS